MIQWPCTKILLLIVSLPPVNFELLQQKFSDDPRLFQLADRLSFSQTQRIYLKNLLGSSSQFVAASVFNHPSQEQYNHLFIVNDAEEAAYFHNSLESITNELNLFYFPSSFKHPKNFRLLNSSHVMLRTEALTKFSMPTGQRVGAMVTYPDALFEKVVLPKKLQGNMLLIKTNDTLDVDNMMGFLVDLGFERTDFVYQPGQFAVRGGIFDIYSFGNEKPYRLELFGNDVDSIRIFDPETQLSERRLAQVSIIPNVETQFESGEKVSLFDFLPGNTIVWIKDFDVMKERLLTMEEDMGQFLRLPIPKHERDDDERLEKMKNRYNNFIPLSLVTNHTYYIQLKKETGSSWSIIPNINRLSIVSLNY